MHEGDSCQYTPYKNSNTAPSTLSVPSRLIDGLLGVALVGGTALVASAAAAIIGVAIARKISN